jgi:hypothetical protein
MADSINPSGSNSVAANFLPNFYKTDSNKKFLQATVDQLVQPGTVKKINGYIGRKNSKATVGGDVFINAPTVERQHYQFEPSFVINDTLGNTTYFKDYIDYINQLGVFGSNTSNHARLNSQEFYSWNPHIDWDKFVNFQNYYWLPYGPDLITIYGQKQKIDSTYNVTVESAGDGNQYLFTPNGLTRNPVLRLYRGQTYKFKIKSPGNPFSIKLLPTLGTSDRYVIPQIDKYGVVDGTITVTLPTNSPSVLYYQSETDLALSGVIQVFSLEDSTIIDVEQNILGKKYYVLADGTPLSNGMKVAFGGTVIPEKYATGNYYVEGVGTAITLVNEAVLEVVFPFSSNIAVLFDTTPFDTLPFSDVEGYAGKTDYILSNRGSADHNPWARYNRWFHKDVIEESAEVNGKTPSLDQSARATRPIIEFEANLKLFNFGTKAVDDVDLVDTFTKDVFSTIEGSLGYNIDSTSLVPGHRVLFTADTDLLVKNKIYQVSFVNIETRRQIHLTEISSPSDNATVLVKQGLKNQSQTYWYSDKTKTWKLAQQKITVNQPPLFDIVDATSNSYGDISYYPGSTFAGTKLFSYKVSSTGTADAVLGFPLTYKNINNIGDIVFNFDLTTDTFDYKKNNLSVATVRADLGYLVSQDYIGNPIYINGWKTCEVVSTQAAVRIYKNSNIKYDFNIDIFDDISKLSDLVVKVYINGVLLDNRYWSVVTNSFYKSVKLVNPLTDSQVLTIKAYASQPINSNGYYEIPLNFQNNPLNDYVTTFTLGEVKDHVSSIIENIPPALLALVPPDPDQHTPLTTVGNITTDPDYVNLRDLGSVTQYGTKFVQHSGPGSLSTYHITSQSNNIVRSIEKAREDYNNFKKIVLTIAEKLGVDSTPAKQVDLILDKINKDKPTNLPYYFSDMVPYGSAVRTDIKVVDYRIKTYPLTNIFTLSTLSNKAVGVYLNGVQLIHDSEYTFDQTGFVIIADKVQMANGNIITTYEYDNTDGSFVPETPTKLGIWPKYEPKIYLDTTLITPRMMIQGHDGSLTLAFGDYRDNIILELEKRIFNNIKVEYDSKIYDIFNVIPSYGHDQIYSRTEFDQTLAPSFYKWTSSINRDFSKPLSYDRTNAFTYNYKGHATPDGKDAPAYWRGIYTWMYNTDRPHLCPWEMLGFTIEPNWWQDTYGPAPYTCNNIILWTDISKGIVKQPGVPPTVLSQYIKPWLLAHLPVDESGVLISPLQSDVVSGIITPSTNNDFVFGDNSPVEAAWRRSSHYPFSILITSMLLTPSKTFGLVLDRSRIVRDLTGQLVYKETNRRIRPSDIVLPNISTSSTRVQTAGIINYIVNYILSDSLKSYTSYKYDLLNLSAKLSYRIGAFSSKEKFNLLLDSKTPLSSGSIFVPQEDYDIVLNSSSPLKKITYSGILVTKLSDGYELKGYSLTQPYFNYYNHVQSGNPLNVGGISEGFSQWTANQQYAAGTIVKYNNVYYRVQVTHTDTGTFKASYFQALKSIPIIGGRTVISRKLWDRSESIRIPYGTKFDTIQEVYDVIIGYGEWLKDQGFVFDDYNPNLDAIANWETSGKEFLFWTTQNWSSGQDKWAEWTPGTPIVFDSILRYNGDYYKAIITAPGSAIFDQEDFIKLEGLSTVGSSVISLSPSAGKLTFNTKLCVIDDIRNAFNGYEIFKVDGTPLNSDFLQSYRKENYVTYSPQSNDGIYCATFYLVQKEQVVLLKNTTMFNDTIYNPPSGYKQDRIKVSGYVSENWYGGFDIPGFIFDQAIVDSWAAWKDYALGDIVKYKDFYYSAIHFLSGTEVFNISDWVKLDKQPKAQLLPNWNYKANQFTDFYNLDSDNFDINQQKVAQHLIGYQKRQYLENIIQDDVSEFKFYQGMIREKGTQNVLNKLFDVLSADGKESLNFYEEWAVRSGQYGASSGFENIEFILDESSFKNNPQGFELVNQITSTNYYDFIIRQAPASVYIKPLGYVSAPWPKLQNYNPYLRSAGYVRESDIAFTFKSIDEVLTADINLFNNGDYIWCTFEDTSWNVYEYTDLNLRVLEGELNAGVVYSIPNKTLTIKCEDLITLSVGTYIGLSGVTGLDGFYKITSIELNAFTVSATIPVWPLTPPTSALPTWTPASDLIIYALISRRTSSIDTIDTASSRSLSPGELLWTDDSGTGKWASWIYNPVYSEVDIKNSLPVTELKYGKTLAISKSGNVVAVLNGLAETIIYQRSGLVWVQQQVLSKPFIAKEVSGFDPNPTARVGDAAAFSPDGAWFAIGSPLVSYASTKLVGVWSNSVTYAVDDIVSIGNVYYQTLQSGVVGINPTSNNIVWELLPYLKTDTFGTNTNRTLHGAVSLYKRNPNGLYDPVDTILSPLFQNNERFGSSLVFGDNELYVSALGYDTNRGRVYKLNYTTIERVSTPYNSVGSEFGILAVTSTAGVQSNMSVIGTGFKSGQTVAYTLTKLFFAIGDNISAVKVGMYVSGTNVTFPTQVYSIYYDLTSIYRGYVVVQAEQDLSNILNVTFSDTTTSLTRTVVQVTPMNTVLLSGSPDSEPSGIIKFVTISWAHDLSKIYAGETNQSNFGNAISLSTDTTVLSISASAGSVAGKVYVYKKSAGTFSTIPTQTLVGIDYNFGQAVSLSDSGEYLAISDDLTDGTSIIQQGRVSVYKSNGSTYSLYQNLVNYEPQINGRFGSEMSFMNDSKTLVVYSTHGDTDVELTFNNDQILHPTISGEPTTFDKKSTNFVTTNTNTGRVDIYDRYSSNWVFSETLSADTRTASGYGSAIAVGNNSVFVGAPFTIDQGLRSGKVYNYIKNTNTYSWTIKDIEIDKPDPYKIKQVFLYNKTTDQLLKKLDVIDPLQGKIPGIAAEEIKYSTFYDPAIYSVGTDVTVDDNAQWTTDQVGALWWDLRTAKFIESYDSSISYRNSTWNTLAHGASIDIYEWVSTTLLPAEWDKRTDTEVGLAQGISGVSLYGNTAYSVKKKYDTISQTFKNTYCYWVKNKKIVPNVVGRHISAAEVSNLIANPRGQGYTYIAITGLNSFSLVNTKSLLTDTDTVLSVEYWTIDKTDQNIHSQWKLINLATSTAIPKNIEKKWFDSLCGKDDYDRVVPDINLPVKLRYGIENRPRQGMFINRIEALKQVVEKANAVLLKNQIVENRDISALSSSEDYPSLISGKYDTTADTAAELVYANVGGFKRPILSPTIIDGKITGIVITYSGQGYVSAPYIDVFGSGADAKIRTIISTDGLGKIIGATVLNAGSGYDNSTLVLVRDYSVLVYQDENASNNWSIYSYDPVGLLWSRIRTKTYNTADYWSKVDWYASGYSSFTAADYSVNTYSGLSQISDSVAIGKLVIVRYSGTSGWQLLVKYANSVSIDWTQSYKIVGIEKGTIQLNSDLYSFSGTPVGYDASTYDGTMFDTVASNELRIILTALRDNIFIDDLSSAYLDLFFVSIRYIFTEQLYIDWVFKTSFIKAKHNVGELTQPVTYRNDNLSNFEDYVNEVKPYRTNIREYISSYDKIDTSQTSITDFDLPSAYENKIISSILTSISNNTINVADPIVTTYPWKHWLDNIGYTVTSIELVSAGSGYISEPKVIISNGAGTGATATALVSNGSVSRIILLTNGKRYLSAPTITFAGGLAADGISARAVAIIGTSSESIIGNNVVRSNLIKIKFDRITQSYFITTLQQTETKTGASGLYQFTLTWAPDIRIGTSSVTINGALVLRDLYKLKIIQSTTKGYTSYSGLLEFTTAPAVGSVISITYLKDWSLLNAADRIQYYYNPRSGDLGKDLSQLMTGIDYGGVIVDGLNFDLSTGWDSNGYGTDAWDEFDDRFDDYITVVSANTHSFTLPYVPATTAVLNVYYIKNIVDTYTSNGTQTQYKYNIANTRPIVTASFSVTSTGVVTKTTGSGNSGTSLKVLDTTGIVVGMGIVGAGFNSLHIVKEIVNSTTLRINKAPISAIGSTLDFVNNSAGSSTILVSNTSSLRLGDIVTSTAINAFNSNAKIKTIVNSTTLILDQILIANIPNNSAITFSRVLVTPIDLTVYATGTIKLATPLASGTVLSIEGPATSIRIDDPFYGTVNQTNSSAVMLSPIGNGSASTFVIPNTFVVNNKDEFIWRKSTSDGSVAPQVDYDSAISGGDTSKTITGAFATATGLAADDIILDGDGFVTPTSSPAPEEVVPGQVVDSVAIKVYDQPNSGSASVKIDNYITNGTQSSFVISQTPNSPRALIVKIGNTIKEYTTDYTVDYKTKTIKFVAVPTAGQTVSIFSIGFSGKNILDLDNTTGNGTTVEFITKAPWLAEITSLIYLNGKVVTAQLFKTDTTYESPNRVGIRFNTAPAIGDLINYIIVSGTQQTFAVTATEKIIPTVSATTFPLTYPIGNSLPNEASIIVRVDQTILPGPSNTYYTIGSNKLNYSIGASTFTPGSLNSSDITVLADNKLLKVGADYSVDLNGITIKINKRVYNLNKGKQLVIIVSADAGYIYYPPTQNTITLSVGKTGTGPYQATFRIAQQDTPPLTGVNYIIAGNANPLYNGTYTCTASTVTSITLQYASDPGAYSIAHATTITPVAGSIVFAQAYTSSNLIEIISSYQHDILDINRTSVSVSFSQSVVADTPEYYYYKDIAGGQLVLSRSVIDDGYVWVTKNNILLSPTIDYKVNDSKNSITLAVFPQLNDKFMLITFSSNIITAGVAYMQFKDMLNRVHYKRLSVNKKTTLVQDLNFNDLQIVVADASNFDKPNLSQNKPGVIEIKGERIEYFVLTGNTLSNIRRGTLGTGIPNKHVSSSIVQDIGPSETIPYVDTSLTEQIVSDGTTTVPLSYTPANVNEIEVFVGGYDISEWLPNTNYFVGTIFSYASYTYKVTVNHTSGSTWGAVVNTIQQDGTIIARKISANLVYMFFIGNIRLRKRTYTMHNSNIAPNSPEGDITLSADFTVDGITNKITLLTPLRVGTRVTVIKRTGINWDIGLNNDSKISNFLKATPGISYSPLRTSVPTVLSATSFDSNNGTLDTSSITFDKQG